MDTIAMITGLDVTPKKDRNNVSKDFSAKKAGDDQLWVI
jgi:hypothetical protein